MIADEIRPPLITVSQGLFLSISREFAFYDIKTKKFVVEPGEFNIQVGPSSAELLLKAEVTL